MKRATNVARKKLISMGMCIGKFTKSKKFHMQVTALEVIAPYAKVFKYVCVGIFSTMNVNELFLAYMFTLFWLVLACVYSSC